MIFVTGGTGLIGSHLIIDLLKQGKEVLALKRARSSTSELQRLFKLYHLDSSLFEKISWIEGDIRDIFVLKEAMQRCDQVYHCAALVSFHTIDADRLSKINVEGTANVVNAALEADVKKLCFVSSTAAIGKSKKGNVINEKTKWDNSFGSSNYAISKHLAEREVWRATAEGLSAVIVNPSIVIGPGTWGNSSTVIFNTVWKGLKFYTEGWNAFVDVRDVSKAMIQLMESDITNERFLLIGENQSYKQIFDWIAESMGKPAPSIKISPFLIGLAWRAERVKQFLFGTTPSITKETARSAIQNNRYSNQKIKDAIGFEFTPLDQSVRQTAQVFLGEIQEK